MPVPSALSGLLGRVLSNDTEIELSGGLNFLGGLLARFNPSTLLTEVSFGDVADHGGLQIADGLHGAAAQSFPDATTRRAGPWTAADVNKIVLQTDTTPATKWWVDSVSSGVAAFSQITTTPESLIVSPLTTMTGHVLQMFEAAHGLTTSGWTDQSPSPANLSGGVDWIVGSDGVSSYAQVTGTQYKSSALTLPTPSVTPVVMDLIVQQDSFAFANPLCSQGTGGPCSIWQSTSGNVRMNNGSNGPTAAFALSAFKRVRGIFTGATSGTADSLQIGSGTPVTGFAGNTLPTGLTLGAAGGSFFVGKWRAAYVYNAIPSAPQATALDAYYVSLYGSGIL
jgi:hypothetical protein